MNSESPSTFQDITLKCAACQQDFVHTVADQQRYAERGFGHTPKRCPPCREKRRNEAANKTEPAPKPAPMERMERPERGMERPRRPMPGRRSFGGGGFGDRSRGGGGGGGGGDVRREYHTAVCSSCGMETRVPFQPIEGRPVYCRNCYRAKRH